jgi:hypothetical protein
MGPLPIFSAFVEAAQATGGTAYSPDEFADLDQALARVFEDFRRRYVLYHRPSSVKPEGWHEITVRISRPGSYTIRARRGYFGG